MQLALGFTANEVEDWLCRLRSAGGEPSFGRRRTPLGQLVKSIISSRTRDAVSTAAYNALVARWPDLTALADVAPAQVERVIEPVTFAADKASYLVAAMAQVRRERPNGLLEFLGQLPLAAALTWLERLPGVGRKVAASTLNASTLALPVFIVDTHVLRVLARLGFIAAGADYRTGSEAVTAAAWRWPGEDLLRLHILMKRLGQEVCRWDAADCARCPLAPVCPRTGVTA